MNELIKKRMSIALLARMTNVDDDTKFVGSVYWR